jgi:iron complex transport system permease protein
MNTKIQGPVLMCGALFFLAALICPLLGPTPISPTQFFSALLSPDMEDPVSRILWITRLPRVALALVCGAALALAGATMQALLRNPLAEPFTLGLSGGATLGLLVAVRLLPASLIAGTLAPIILPIATFLGAFLALLLVMTLARGVLFSPKSFRGSSRGLQIRPDILILCGVVMNTLTGALILLIQYRSDPFDAALLLRWILGGVDVADFGPALIVLLAGLPLLWVLLARSRILDLLELGDRPAHQLGVAVERQRLLLLLVTSALTALVVAHTGPIAFVGLIIPHILRLILGPSHSRLMPCCALLGGAFLSSADALARTVVAPAELPVGLLTALAGAPFFLVLLGLKAAPVNTEAT